MTKDFNIEVEKRFAKLQERVGFLEDIIFAAKDILSLSEAAAFMGVTKSCLYKMTHEQTIPYFKPNGKLVYFDKCELVNWMRQNRVSSKAELATIANSHLQTLGTKATGV